MKSTTLGFSTLSNKSFRQAAEKRFCQISRRFGHSTSICLTVGGSLEGLEVGYSSVSWQQIKTCEARTTNMKPVKKAAFVRQRVLQCRAVSIFEQTERSLFSTHLFQTSYHSLRQNLETRGMRSQCNRQCKSRLSCGVSPFVVWCSDMTNPFRGSRHQIR